MMDYTFEYPEYDPDGRLLERIGPDGKVTKYTYDELGRLETAIRNFGLPTEEFGVTLYYDDAGRLWKIDYSNGTSEIRVYDDANRLTEVRHEGPLGVLYKTTYAWTINNWVDNRVEYDYTVPPGTSAFVDFEYDNRGRLIGESRVVDGTTTVYDLWYTYDQLGNRRRRQGISGSAVRGRPLQ